MISGKTVKSMRQGDLLIRPKTGGLSNAEKSKTKLRDSRVVLEGEVTGHAHKLTAGQVFLVPEDMKTRGNESELLHAYLEVPAGGATLEHDEHNPIQLAPGAYEVRRQREFIGGLTRIVAD